ncbi:MAG TPA: c-type cytochrome [Solirubrobacteraceae bacterium]|nr:c-type cytochrome [Solirubrobacteraceae bacterium]
MVRRTVRGLALGACAIGAAALLAGCASVTDRGDNVVNGKQLFVSKCGSCHILNRAGTKGVTGPNLDQAFRVAREDGFRDSTFEGIVHRQIGQPARRPQVDPVTKKTLPLMPANLVTGDDARDVAAYVASAVSKGGKDQGALAQIGAAEAKGTAKEKNGKLEIPADPGGALAYVFANAEATAGPLEIESKNDASIEHDIAIEGNGVNEKGEIVSNGGVSKISTNLKAGEYTFFCSVTGHRQAGMEGKLTVK